MFLKRIEMQGFKSFADKTTISFENALTGIVGPNGCGKSNISDAIRWVLGEQSAKSMRGEKMNDIIFAGSLDRSSLNVASVTLVFDNTNHILNRDTAEIEVTRKIYRDASNAQYFINKQPVRLKDIVDLFLDTGLGKDSLSIISQGNIVSFAEAKPLERRGIFEEAAGVAKYKKKRIESLAALERTRNNLDRCSDLLAELEKQISPLKRQAHKAEIYREKKTRLEQIEIAFLTKEIQDLKQQKEIMTKKLADEDANQAISSTNIEVLDTKLKEKRASALQLDKHVADLQDQLMRVLSDIQAKEKQKTTLDEKRKYVIHAGNQEEKLKAQKRLAEEARLEYEDRNTRLQEIIQEVKLLDVQLRDVAFAYTNKQSDYDRANGILNSLQNRKSVIEQLLTNPFNNQAGIKAIQESQRFLPGILGVVGQVLVAESGYEEAISTALGGALQNIVTKDSEAARNAIRFLTKNQAGRATFLPLTVCQPRTIYKDAQIIADNTEGYLGAASEFVTCDSIYEPVVQSLLGNVFVCDTLEHGNTLSDLTKRQYKIVTLDGEIIHKGGSMTGGKAKHNANIMTMRKEYDDIKADIDAQQASVALAKKALDEIILKRDQIRRDKQDKIYAQVALEPVVEAKKAKYNKLQNELTLLNPRQTPLEEQDDTDAKIIAALNKAYMLRDDITSKIKSDREQRHECLSEAERMEVQLRKERSQLKEIEDKIHSLKLDETKLDTILSSDLERLSSEYQLTYEASIEKLVEFDQSDLQNARDEVATLRSEIVRLGNVNMNAPEEFAEVNTRYETMKASIDELLASRDKILASIDEMDCIMKKNFKETFDAINLQFDEIFKNLYGGGKAHLSLSDPDDILNTGIEIFAQPPGKNVQNNMLFSGGEKSLIALCVLFAILKVKPVPLVILDEVEAALDPSNVERFAQYLHNYTDRTQFLVVSHRVGTMSKCDVLYGVTMQQRGVSQMMKVNLKDAMQLTDEKENI